VSSYMLSNSENAYKQAQAAVAQAKAAVNRAKVNLGFVHHHGFGIRHYR